MSLKRLSLRQKEKQLKRNKSSETLMLETTKYKL